MVFPTRVCADLELISVKQAAMQRSNSEGEQQSPNMPQMANLNKEEGQHNLMEQEHGVGFIRTAVRKLSDAKDKMASVFRSVDSEHEDHFEHYDMAAHEEAKNNPELRKKMIAEMMEQQQWRFAFDPDDGIDDGHFADSLI